MASSILAPLQQILASNGTLGVGLKVFTYESGTTTKLTTYPTAADADAATNANTNPVVLDARGEASMWLPDSVTKYKLVLALASDTDPPASPIVTEDAIATNLTVNQLQNNTGRYAVATGSSSAYVLTLSPALAAYKAGQVFYFEANHTNSGASTLNINGLGAKDIKRRDGTAVPNGLIISGEIYTAVYDGTNFIALEVPLAGAVLQTLSTTKTDTFTTTATTAAGRDLVTGLTRSITPKSTASNVLVRVTMYLGNTAASALVYAALQRDSTLIGIGDAASSRGRESMFEAVTDSARMTLLSQEILDSPASTSAIVYGASIWGGSDTTTVNRTGADSDLSTIPRVVSTITAMEIAG